MMPSSMKGRNRKRTRTPVPISDGLAMRLKRVAAGRRPNEPLLLSPKGFRWDVDDTVRYLSRKGLPKGDRSNRRRPFFADAAEAAGLPDHATLYCLRHTAITNALVDGRPVRLVAATFDTSIEMIENTYSINIANHGDDQMRESVFEFADNVVPMKKKSVA
jgi:integrase